MDEIESSNNLTCYSIYGPNQNWCPGRYLLVAFVFRDGEAIEGDPPIASAESADELVILVPTNRVRIERREDDHEALICSFV